MQLLEHTCTIRRYAAVGTNGRKQLADFATGVACLALPMSDSTAIRHNFTLGKAYDIYFEVGQDIRTGDQVVIDGEPYSVRHLRNFKVQIVGHVHALCVKEVS